MNSSIVNKLADHSAESLIDWHTPDKEINKICDENCANNPFDILELKAANMDSLDLISDQIVLREDPPCSKILSPFWEPEVRSIQRTVPLTDIDIANIFEENCIYHAKDNIIVNDKLEDDIHVNVEVVDQSKKNCISVHIDENIVQNQEQNTEFFLSSDFNYVDIETVSLCNEEEKRQLREQTRQRIEKLIEARKKSLFGTPENNSESSINITDTSFNKGFIHCGSNNNLESVCYHNYCKTFNNISDTNDSNTSNTGFQELNSFNLDSLKPEWVIDNFIDDASVENQIEKSMSDVKPINTNVEVDVKLKKQECFEIVESKLHGCQTVLKSTQNNKVQNKGPLIANVPIQLMMQNYKDGEFKEINNHTSTNLQIKPVASSTPTSDTLTTLKTPSSVKSLTASRISLSRQSLPNSIESPSTPLNVTKCIKKDSINKLNDKNGNKLGYPNTMYFSNSANKRSNTSINLFNVAYEKKAELTKSKSECNIGKISKPLMINANRMSGLPILKRATTMSFKGKENIKP